MKTSTQMRFPNTLGRIVEYLVRQEYAGLEEWCDGVRLRATEIESAVTEYGRMLVRPPPSAYDEIDAILIQGKTPPAYSIRFPLYTREEGRSDLELQATLIDSDPSSGLMRVELDGILVA